MKVFLAGASGAIGRRLIPLLRHAGHDVWGMSRSEAGAGVVRDLGARPVICDVFDAAAVERAVAAAGPDAVVHQITQVPKAIDPRRYDVQFAGNDRIRIEGTRHLVAAARAAGVQRFVAQSIAFAYAPEGGWVKSEDAPLHAAAPMPFRRTVDAVQSLEQLTLDAGGIVLRYGFFYGPGTAYASDGSMAEQIRRRRIPVLRGFGMQSFVHVDDAASAVPRALEHDGPATFNIADGEPAHMSEWLPVLADAMGAPPPLTAPRLLARVAGGWYTEYMVGAMRGASNAKATRMLAWSPRHSSWRSGFLADLDP